MNLKRLNKRITIFLIILILFMIVVGRASNEESTAVQYIDSCTKITVPGTYILSKDILNSNSQRCIEIASSNVILNGAGHLIDGKDSFNTFGVYVYSSIKPLANITVEDLSIKDWNYGLYNNKINNVSILNNEIISNTYGIFFKSSNNSILNYNNVSLNTYGINIIYSNNNTLINNIANSNVYGILLYSSNNSILNYNNASLNTYGINIISSNNNILTKSVAYSNTNGIYLKSSSNNTIEGNIADSMRIGFAIKDFSNSNILTNNSIMASNESVSGIYIDSSSFNKIKGGSIKAINSIDYYFKNSSALNEFTYTDFTGPRKIFFNDPNSFFNYNNDINSSIWLRTNISASGYLNRTIVNWNKTLVQLNDTGNRIVNYTLTGLLNNSIYDIYYRSQGIKTESNTLKTDSNGNLPTFMIALNGVMELKIMHTNNSLEISRINIANITLNEAEISWQTNEPSDSLIKFGRYSNIYTYEKYNSSLVMNHSITLSNLWLATNYSFVINSTNQLGNSRESQEFNVKTLSPFSNSSSAMVYERLSDGIQNDIGRNISNMTDLFNMTNTDIIFRGWWIEGLMIDNCNQFKSPSMQKTCQNLSDSYDHLRNATTMIKQISPNISIIGAVPAQQIYETTYNPVTEKGIKYPESWNMAFDPAKFGIMNISKEQFQCDRAKNRSWLNETFDCTQYNPENVTAYIPDITNENFQELLFSLAKKQIDSGEDAIWFDGLFSQAYYLAGITNDSNNSGVNASYFASSKIIDEIHDYKQGVYAGTWSVRTYSYPSPNLDFVTLSPSREEILNQSFDEESWNISIKTVRDTRGDIPIIAFIDWDETTNTPLGAFSQNLSIQNQSNFLNIADAFFQKKGIIFAYPLHGGHLGSNASILSFGKYKFYDALAPEFYTFDTIKQLSLKKDTNAS